MSELRVPRIVWIVTDDGGASVELEPLDDATASRLDVLGEDRALSVRFAAADADTEGHAFSSPSDVVIDILLDDDTEGHAVRMRFANPEDAAAFRRRVLTLGSLEAAISRGDRVRASTPADRPASAAPRS